jgi:tRNA(Ile)-lysidine synthase TilS/MesJ
MESLGVPYFLEKDAIVERARESMGKNSICSFCARMKRGMIYSCARREGYNVIAMGQHLDDLAESFVMSSFHNGKLRTMKANYTNDVGDLRIIRPLVTCREKLFKDFSEQIKLPIIMDNCPACFSAPKERHRIKLMLAQQEHLFPSLFSSLLKTMNPLMRGDLKDILVNGGASTADGDSDVEAEAAMTSGLCGL